MSDEAIPHLGLKFELNADTSSLQAAVKPHVDELLAATEATIRAVPKESTVDETIPEDIMAAAGAVALSLLGRTMGKAAAEIIARAILAERQRHERLTFFTNSVYDTFAADLKNGYQTKDKQFAVSLLGKALGRPSEIEP